MDENPVAEEPNYRSRVIIAIPSLKILDRHGKIYLLVKRLISLVVTLEDQMKAKEWFNTEVRGIEKNKKLKRPSAWQASLGIIIGNVVLTGFV